MTFIRQARSLDGVLNWAVLMNRSSACENNKFYASHSGNYNYGKTSMTMAITTPTTPIPCTTITTA